MSGQDVSSRDDRIFSDVVSSFYGKPATKSSASSAESLEMLLDRSSIRSMLFDDAVLTEVPFREEYSSEPSNMSFFCPESFSTDSLSIVKMSLLDWYDSVSGEHKFFVVTMIPYQYYDSAGENAGYSFIESLPDFCGVMLFSEPDSTYISSYEYIEGSCAELNALPPSEVEDDGTPKVYLSFPAAPISGTKALDKIVVTGSDIYLCLDLMTCPAVCIADRPSSGDGCSNTRGVNVGYLVSCIGSSTMNTPLYAGGNVENKKGTSLQELAKSRAEYSIIIQDIKFEADTREELESLNNLMDFLSKIPELRTILENLKLDKVSVTMVSSLSNPYALAETVPVRHSVKGEFKYYTWEIRVTAGCTTGALLEELFHVFQYQKSPDWLAGDLEFEAKIFDILMGAKYGSLDYGNGKLLDYFDYLRNYYNNPSGDTYFQVLGSLDRLGYDRDDYPLSDVSYENRIKHIQYIIKHTAR